MASDTGVSDQGEARGIACSRCQAALDAAALYCPGCGRPATRRSVPLRRQRWWVIFIIGLALYWLTEEILKASGNPNIAPTVMLLGAFLVPVTFVAYLYEADALYDVSPIAVALTFLYGGVLGTVAAQLLEQEIVLGMGIIGMLAVGVSEELAKPLGLLWLARKNEYATELHGIVLGAAAGMGFAALETMGYAFTYFIVSRGNMDVLGQVLISRGLLSPLAHGTWTAILVGTIWRERSATGAFRLNGSVLRAFALVVVLHALWDWTASAIPIEITLPQVSLVWKFIDIVVPAINLPVPGLVIGGLGLLVLARMVRQANRIPLRSPGPAAELPTDLAVTAPPSAPLGEQ